MMDLMMESESPLNVTDFHNNTPDPVEFQNAMEKMVSLESHIANLEREIGDLKEREPSEGLLHKCKAKRDPGNRNGIGWRDPNDHGAQYGQGGSGERGRGGNRGSWEGRGGSCFPIALECSHGAINETFYYAILAYRA